MAKRTRADRHREIRELIRRFERTRLDIVAVAPLIGNYVHDLLRIRSGRGTSLPTASLKVIRYRLMMILGIGET